MYQCHWYTLIGILGNQTVDCFLVHPTRAAYTLGAWIIMRGTISLAIGRLALSVSLQVFLRAYDIFCTFVNKATKWTKYLSKTTSFPSFWLDWWVQPLQKAYFLFFQRNELGLLNQFFLEVSETIRILLEKSNLVGWYIFDKSFLNYLHILGKNWNNTVLINHSDIAYSLLLLQSSRAGPTIEIFEAKNCLQFSQMNKA